MFLPLFLSEDTIEVEQESNYRVTESRREGEAGVIPESP
jgi:hypothetical protein